MSAIENADLLLVSTSPRRIRLVEKLGISVFSVAPLCDETLNTNLSVPDQIMDLAQRKARSVPPLNVQWVLAADTVVVLNGQILGKPESEDHAVAMLKMLSQNTATVLTGYALYHVQSQTWQLNVISTRLRFKALREQQIIQYVQTGEPLDKAGAFGIQGQGRMLIDSVEGDFDNVVGLPVAAILMDMQRNF